MKNRLKRIALLLPVLVLMFVLSSAAVNRKFVNTTTGYSITDTIPKGNKVFSQVEKMPEFTGGLQKFGEFLRRSIRYPAMDRANKVEGRVYLQFIVEKNGTLSNIKAVRGPSETLMEEAIRVLSSSPNWAPGIQNGKVVRVAYTVPINFTLGNHETTVAPKTTSVIIETPGDTYSVVDKQPLFPGGITAFGEFLSKNIKYPAEMREKKIEGRVIVTFVVEKDGSLSNIVVAKDIGYGSSEEAVRVMNLSPKWEPGYQNNKAVRVAYTVPINFSLQKSDKYFKGR